MMKTICFVLFLGVTFLGVSKANALQEFSVRDGESVVVKLSSREVNRIAIKGDGKISKAWGTKGLFEIKPDKVRGEAYIKTLTMKPASFFVRDDLGNTYTIVAEKADIPAETVLLTPRSIGRNKKSTAKEKTTPYKKEVKRLLKAMANQQPTYGYTINEITEEVPLWKESHIVLLEQYSGYQFIGEIYLFTNVSDEEMVLSEYEFLDFGENVAATALDKLTLREKEGTYLYVVRRVKDK